MNGGAVVAGVASLTVIHSRLANLSWTESAIQSINELVYLMDISHNITPSIVHSVPSHPQAPEITEAYSSHIPGFSHLNLDLNTSVTDSDSVASYSESEAGSQLSDQLSGSSSVVRPPSTQQQPGAASAINKDTVEIRAVHNVSEQHRRKYLKSCFDNLQKEVVPESTSKASHLCIITSALEAIQRVREQDFQLKRDNERALEEHRQLRARLDEVVRDLLSVDSTFDVNEVLVQADLANPDGFHPLTSFDRHIEPFQIEETVEIVPPSGTQKRPCLDVSDDLDAQNMRKSAKMPALTNSRKKDQKRGKNRTAEPDDGVISTDDMDSPSVELLKPETSVVPNGVMIVNKIPREPIPLRVIDEPDEGLADPDVPLPVLRRSIYNLGNTPTLTINERRKLAAEKGLPLHLANGVPTLPGTNYWGQSLCAFPAFVRRSRPFRSTRKFAIPSAASSGADDSKSASVDPGMSVTSAS